MSLERDGPGETLEDRVRETLESAGWTEDDRGFSRTLRRVTFRGRLADFVVVARGGLPVLERLLTRENRRLERASEVNSFRERRLAAALPEAVSEMLERGVGAKLVRTDEDGRPLKPRGGVKK